MIKYAIKQTYVHMLEFISRKQPNIREIQKQTKKTYIHVRDVLIYCQEKNIIEPIFGEQRLEGYNRDYKVILTKKGKKVLNLFRELNNLEQ